MFSGGSKGNIGKKRVKINQIRDILNFDDFTVPKIVLDNKVIKKNTNEKRSRKFGIPLWRELSDKLSRNISAIQD